MDFSHEELGWLGNALNEVLHGPDAIEDWEFGTRMGGTRGEVHELLHKVTALYREGHGDPSGVDA